MAKPEETDANKNLGATQETLRQLWEEHGSDIRFEDGIWCVPSQHDHTSVYEVTLGRRGESCECQDFGYRGQSCKHVYPALVCRSKTAPCSGCGSRFRHRDLFEVTEDHESLTHFPGDPLCRDCALAHGIL